MPSIFLSHNSKDKRFVRRLAERLAKSGVTVWLDEVELKVGDSIAHKISKAIDQVEYVAAVISSNSVSSQWVQKEISLAITKEVGGSRPVVLPIRLDNCEMPDVLQDKLYADFRKPRSFAIECKKLMDAMGVIADREHLGMTVEWTDEGPRIAGRRVALSSTEGRALLDRWKEWLPKLIEQEKRSRGEHSEDVMPAANVLAVVRACGDTYNRIPDEEEIRQGETELARKFDLFFSFMVLSHMKDLGLEVKGNIPRLIDVV